MHILMIPSWYPTDNAPISGVFFREQALAISSSGVKVGLISPHLYSLKKIISFDRPKTGLHTYSDYGVKTYRLYDWNWSYKLSNCRRNHWLSLGYKLFKLYVKENGFPDLIHVQSTLLGGTVALEIYKRYSTPFIVTEHSSQFALKLLNNSELNACKKIFSGSAKNIVVSPSLGHILENQLLLENFSWTWIPNFLDKRFENQARKKSDSLLLNSPSNEDFVFLNIANATSNKRQANLIKAFSRVFKGQKNIKLKIGGSGPALKDLKRITYEEKLQDQVYFLGDLSRNEVLDEMTAATAFVLSSYYETFGIVLIEALACGKPVIATQCGGPECIVEKGDGLLVENSNIAALSTAMQSLKSSIEAYDSDDIKRRCLNRFGSTPIIKKIIEVYASIIQGNLS